MCLRLLQFTNYLMVIRAGLEPATYGLEGVLPVYEKRAFSRGEIRGYIGSVGCLFYDRTTHSYTSLNRSRGGITGELRFIESLLLFPTSSAQSDKGLVPFQIIFQSKNFVKYLSSRRHGLSIAPWPRDNSSKARSSDQPEQLVRHGFQYLSSRRHLRDGPRSQGTPVYWKFESMTPLTALRRCNGRTIRAQLSDWVALKLHMRRESARSFTESLLYSRRIFIRSYCTQKLEVSVFPIGKLNSKMTERWPTYPDRETKIKAFTLFKIKPWLAITRAQDSTHAFLQAHFSNIEYAAQFLSVKSAALLRGNYERATWRRERRQESQRIVGQS